MPPAPAAHNDNHAKDEEPQTRVEVKGNGLHLSRSIWGAIQASRGCRTSITPGDDTTAPIGTRWAICADAR